MNRLSRRSFLTSAVVSAGALALTSCASGASGSSAQGDAHIALVVPLSGLFARQGTLSREGAEMARDEINANGGIKALGGAKIRLDVSDAGETVESAVSAANHAFAGRKLSGGIGSYLSSMTLGVTEVSERHRLPWLTESYADTITDRGFHYVYQTSSLSSQQAAIGLARYKALAASKGVHIKRIALVGDNTASSKIFFQVVRENLAAKLGMKVVASEIWTPPLSDASSIAQRLRSAKPDLIVYSATNFSDSSQILRASKQFGVTAPILGNGAWLTVPEYAKNLGAGELEGISAIVAAFPLKNGTELDKRFRARTGEPYMTQDSLAAYYHVWLFKEAMEKAKSTDPQKINEALKSLDLTTGPAARNMAGGRVRFDDKGRRMDASPVIVQWQGGRPRSVWPAAEAVAKFKSPRR
ncbi:ABC transporter substrate-binding protein [Streptomyces sp. NPDC020490]|uniref:ABC transporter substrate-binding protein n=1 Tax=Streptomyces sp. NPDC020490 TaxID=3365078 RepID=UPI0037B75398